MMPVHELLEALAVVQRTLLFHALPFAVYGAIAPRVPWIGKLVTIGCYLALAFAARKNNVGSEFLTGVFVAWAYLGAAALAVLALRRAIEVGALNSGGAFVFCAFLFTFLPPLVVGQPVPMLIIIGWEMMFSGYSYCVHACSLKPPNRA